MTTAAHLPAAQRAIAGEALLSPARIAVWERLADVAEHGVAQLVQWGPADGLPHPAERPSHQHTMPTLTICLRGQVRVIGREMIDLKPGDVLVIEPGCWHRHLATRSGAIAFSLGFIADRCDLIFNEEEVEQWGAIPGQPYRTLLTTLIDEDRPAERLRLIDEMLHGIIAERVDAIDWRRRELLDMARFLWWHLHEHLDVDHLIQRSGLGRTLAFSLFKSLFGRSPKQEILAQRVDLARHLIHRGYSVGDAAHRSGFASRAALSQAFLSRLGHAPSQVIPRIRT
jgi:AraC-like DNA-binding protein